MEGCGRYTLVQTKAYHVAPAFLRGGIRHAISNKVGELSSSFRVLVVILLLGTLGAERSWAVPTDSLKVDSARKSSSFFSTALIQFGIGEGVFAGTFFPITNGSWKKINPREEDNVAVALTSALSCALSAGAVTGFGNMITGDSVNVWLPLALSWVGLLTFGGVSNGMSPLPRYLLVISGSVIGELLGYHIIRGAHRVESESDAKSIEFFPCTDGHSLRLYFSIGMK